jgi:predicted GIY-YIG superfamily endonuclease
MASEQNYVYSLNLENGKKYVGRTSNLEQRLNQHFSGHGAEWTKKNPPVSVNHIQKCKTPESAKKAETIVYNKMKEYHGKNNVRGAGNTRS